MSDAKQQRQQLLNVSAAHTHIATACDLLARAERILKGERNAGLPTDTAQLHKTVYEAQIARDQLLIFLKRMP